MAGGVWSERDTTPSAVEEALRQLITEQCARHDAYAPARVLNLVVVVDREWRGEIMNRLDRVGRYHPSRTILCAVEHGRTTIDATVAITAVDDPKPGELALTRERVVLDLGPASPREARHDRRPARRHRHRDGRVVAARPPGGGRRAAAPRPRWCSSTR